MDNWKEKLKVYYKTKYWQAGIDLMEEVIFNDKDNRDAYLNICHFLINILAYEDFDINYLDYYEHLFNKYFEISYGKFKDDPIYLHFIADIINCAEWIVKDKNINYRDLFHKALLLEPDNTLFKSKNYKKKIYDICFNDTTSKREENIKKMEIEIDNFCEIVVYEYDNIKEKYSKIGKVGELEVEYFETFCYKQLVKIGKIEPDVLPNIF